MGKAIKISTKKAEKGYYLGASKFFGTPTVPDKWTADFYEDEIFFCQIGLCDIASLDADCNLPHTGYLYVFLHTEDGDYNLRADVRYYNGEPNVALDDFNAEVQGYEHFTQAWLMDFEVVDGAYDGTKLFGTASDWNYEEDEPRLLMQFDPLDNDMGFLDFLDGYLYLLLNDNDLSKTTLRIEHS